MRPIAEIRQPHMRPSRRLELQLEELLGEEIEQAVERERSTFDTLAAPLERSIVLFGAGNLGRMTLAGLRAAGTEPLAFADNNPRLWDTTLDGLQVLSPQRATATFGRNAVFVVTIWGAGCRDRTSQRIQQLETLGCERVVSFGPLFWKYPQHFLPHYALDSPHKVLEQAALVREAFGLWADEASRFEYVAQLRWRTLLDFDALPAPAEHKPYFPEDLCPLSAEEVFIDCGAFDGDTLKDFLALRSGAFHRIVAFEPDPVNWERLMEFVSTLPASVRERIDLRPAAVGGRTERLNFSVTGTAGSAAGQGTYEVDSCSLDEALDGLDPTWIKMDIEGFEAAAIEGARRLIERSRPVLAINLEHRQEDLWRIPILVQSIAEGYRFFLRSHLLEGWDLVCCAIPGSRCAKGPREGA